MSRAFEAAGGGVSPYGIPAAKGGESPVNTLRMERCVNELMAQGKPKANAIAICKASLGFVK